MQKAADNQSVAMVATPLKKLPVGAGNIGPYAVAVERVAQELQERLLGGGNDDGVVVVVVVHNVPILLWGPQTKK